VPKDLVFSADRSLALIRPARDKLTPEFAKLLLESETVQARMVSKAIGTAQKHLYLRDLRSLEVTIPEVSAQSKIVLQLAPFKHAISSLATTINAAKRLASEVMTFVFGPIDV
jgi:restriction endonuclease S subunit